MIYRVEHWKDGERVLDAAWTGEFSTLKDEAIRQVDAGDTDQIKIFDQDGQIWFQHPPVLSNV